MKLKIPFITGEKQEDKTVNVILAQIKAGNDLLKEKFINDYKPFILKAVHSTTGKPVEIENSEEYSVGLLAFNESIDSFDESKNRNFFGFSEQVIRRRVIDYIRKNKMDNTRVLPFTYFENEDNNNFEERFLQSGSANEYDNIEVKEEILTLKKKLKGYGITFRDLLLCAPKHKDSRIMCIRMARALSDDSVLFEKMERTKTLPIQELLKIVSVYRGTVERNRKFIIAICLIMKSGLEVMKGYVNQTDEGREGNV
ncbi:MAG: RNA polymerase sigma-I factor [Bacillota bacterium]